MAEPFVAEIRIFTGNFAPTGWAMCNGQILPLSQNTVLFSLLGTTYGGDGIANFALPDLRGCAPLHAGQGAGLSLRDLGEKGGEQTVTLLQTEMPAHSHGVQASDGAGGKNPGGNTWAAGTERGTTPVYTTPAQMVQMNPLSLSIIGGSQPHNNMPPFLGLTFIIALQGVYPPR